MTKVKVIAVLALTVVMLTAMTGQVVGWGGGIDSTDIGGTTKIQFIEGELVYATGTVGNNPDGDLIVNLHVTDNTVWANGDIIAHKTVILSKSVTIIPLGGNPPVWQIPTTYLGTVGNGGGPDEIPFPGAYDIAVDLGEDGIYDSSTDEDFVNEAPVECKAFTTEVPEFATIALPVVSVLGLLLFFNRRKHKKE
jgi:hypothetical protein